MDFTSKKLFNQRFLIIGDTDSCLHFSYRNTYNTDECHKWIFEWEASNKLYGDDKETYPMAIKEDGDTMTLTAYLDDDNAILKDLLAKEKIVATTYADLYGSGGSYRDSNNDGHISADEQDDWIEVGDAWEYVPIYSDEKIKLHTSDKKDATAKERVKITNNLNAPAESEPNTSEPALDPTESTVIPGGTDPAAKPGGSDKPANQDIIEVTLKNVDSENGIEGEALDKLLFGDSGLTWEQVEKIEFSSDDLFSVQFSTDNGGWRKLGEEVAARADDENIWNTVWTLNTSEMAKDKKFAKVIAKDGIIDVTAKVYIKSNAEKPSDGNSGSDQQPTGIALAIAPVVLAASAAIVVFKKKK